MKRLIYIFIAAVTMAVAMSCGHETGNRQALALDPSGEVAPQAAEIVGEHAPRTAARLLVEWLAAAPQSDRAFAMNLSREVYRLYTVSTDSGALEAFASTLELAKDSLPLDKQVNVFMAVSTPENLGRMLRNDPQADTIAGLIMSRYGNDSASVASFINAFRSR